MSPNRGDRGQYAPRSALDRLCEKFVVGDDGCWEWTAAVFRTGYGAICVAGLMKRAHRVAYELAVGPIPDGMDLDHLCRNKRCVNPDHLEPVTRRVNTRRAMGGEHCCPQGHPRTEQNTAKRAGGYYSCRICRREQARRAYRRKSHAA